MKAAVDKDLCIGCGVCQEICPDIFSMDADDKAVAVAGEIPADRLADAMNAKDSCPVEAITIE